MANKIGVKKTSILTFVIYGIIILLIIIVCWFLGAAMDLCVQPNGKIDTNLLGAIRKFFFLH